MDVVRSVIVDTKPAPLDDDDAVDSSARHMSGNTLPSLHMDANATWQEMLTRVMQHIVATAPADFTALRQMLKEVVIL
jgi:hypothetical protein